MRLLHYVARRRDRQLYSAASTNIVRELDSAAATAASQAASVKDGDAPEDAARQRAHFTDLAITMQAEADRIRAAMVEDGLTLADKPDANPDTKKPFNQHHIALNWSQIKAQKAHITPRVIVLDHGDRGSIAIAPSGIHLSGEMSHDPKALLLAMRHAQLHFGASVTMTGDDETKFRMAVAAKMLGVKVNWLSSIPRTRRAEADALAEQWKPMLDEIRSGKPRRPADVRAQSREAAVTDHAPTS
jgi:hypothetical protein